MLYWAYATCGTVAYGDMIPVTNAEKIFDIIAMLLIKIWTAFLYAEAAKMMSNQN